jgi:NADH-quinone oxidoreductase subunit J
MIDLLVWGFFAAVAVGGALVMVLARNPVHSAIGLLATMFSIAVFYVLLNAHFVAAIQVLVYAGAVMTLFLFVIMLIGVDKIEERTERIPFQRPLALVVSVGLAAVIVIAGAQAWITGRNSYGVDDLNGTIEKVADALFGTWMLAFLSTIFLLTIAAVGSVALAYYGAGKAEDS